MVNYSVVDAFADSPFKGNQAAVCLLEEERDDRWLQSVAAEFNLTETSFLTRITESPVPSFRLRWFTPVDEVKLCGHATLAAAHCLFTSGEVDSETIEFVTLSGVLTAKRVPKCEGSNDKLGFFIELNFPVDPPTEPGSTDEHSLMSKALGGASVIDIKCTAALDYLLVAVSTSKSVVDLKPDFEALQKFPGRGIIVTGIAPPGSGFDFYSRFFAPNHGINEDPVTGSAHCSLAPYWSKKLGKHDFVAYQASPRGGVLNVHLDEESQRVVLRGKAFTVMKGTLLV